jgi:hypothetical protein
MDTRNKLLLEQRYYSLLSSVGIEKSDLIVNEDEIGSFVRRAETQDKNENIHFNSSTYDRLRVENNINSMIWYPSKLIIEGIKKMPEFNDAEKNIFPGIFPTGSFNAQALSYEEGIIILVNLGLPEFLKVFSDVFLQYDELQCNLFSRKMESQLNRSDCISLLTDAFVNYVNLSLDSRKYNSVLLVGGMLGQFSSFLNAECTMFVLAHEYAHAILGHLDPGKRMAARHTPYGEIEFMSKSQQEEIQADVTAMFIQAACNSDDDTYFKMAMPMFIMSYCLFFSIDRILTDIYERVMEARGRALIVTDHPPSDVRYNILTDSISKASAISKTFDENVFGLAKILEDSISKIEGQLIENVVEELLRS